MMRKIMFMLVLLAAAGMIFAATVGEERARKVAENILLERCAREEVIWTDAYVIGNNRADFYIFNYTDGYVIISGEDRAIPVLAYSDENTYDPENIPPQLADWFFEWQWQMNEIRENDLEAGNRAREDWARLSQDEFIPTRDLRNVSPLLSCNWNQDSPWNQHCPYGPGEYNPFVYAGCVATSMAQIMYYWGHPSTGTGSHTYYHDQFGNISCNFDETEFDYDNMYNNSATYEAKELQWAAGVAVEMNYGYSGSGAQVGYGQYSARNAMIATFQYHSDATFRVKESFSADAYENFVREDLDNGRPLIYSGVGDGYGHAFNLDGYQGTSYFHFNFGWSGSGNGYFYLSNINPSGNNFNSDQGGVFSLYPNEDLSVPYDFTAVVVNQNDVLLDWDHNALNRSLQGFNVYLNGLLHETTDSDESTLMINDLENGSYAFWVTALFVTGESELSEMVFVTIAPPTAPVADAGEDQTAVSGETVFLNGSSSYDINGDVLSYNWTAPAGVLLSDNSSVNPQFTAPEVVENTNLNFSLIVSDGTFFSEPDEVIITVTMTENSEYDIVAENITLLGNYPNPFNPQTEIFFKLQESAPVTLNIFNVKGELIRSISEKKFNAGRHSILWQGTNDKGNPAGNGVYYYRLRSGGNDLTGKMLLLK